jgi:hypothetical protein
VEQDGFKVHLTPAARELLRPGEALVLEWHRLAICCAGAGETSLSVAKEETVRKRKGLVQVKNDNGSLATDKPPVYAAQTILPHLLGWEIEVDARRVFGIRHFSSDLPRDFGLRSVFGRLPQSDRTTP